MRLYPRAGQDSLVHNGVTYKAASDGGFDLEDQDATEVHSFHVGGKPLWETDIERQHRLISEEMERRKDPATLLDAVNQLVSAARSVTPAGPQDEDGAKPVRRKPAAKPQPA